MRKNLVFFLFIILISCFTNSYAQESKASIKFIRWFFKDKGSILYTNRIFSGGAAALKKDILKDTLKNLKYDNENKINFLVFTDKEKRRLNRDIMKIDSKFRSKNILPGSTLIDRDTIDNILGDRGFGWPKFNERYGNVFYSFSKPIFIRKKTICIFYSDYSCQDTCGSGELAVYKWINNEWVKWLIIDHWVS
ncbi:MAG TPA: hypothetical protein VNI52_00500 [Sphingobacteriaceae bacterium]|nr:hypothetical protein [Sphingobacteriaceae bacterium]